MLIKVEEHPKAVFSQAWFDYKDGVRILVASSNKPSFNRLLELNNIQAEQEMRGIKQVDDESAELTSLAFNRAVSRLILGWTGIDAEENKPFEYSIKNAELLCTSTPIAHEVVSFVVDQAFKLSKDREAILAEEVGKSSSTLNTESTV